MKPRVSVIMPVNNVQTYLTEAIDSILNQKFTDFEFLIITEPGTSHKIIDGYSDRRIRRIQTARRIGLARSLNYGIKEARGEYIARMDADDVSLPGRLERQVTFLDEHQHIGIVGTGCECIDETGRTLSICSNSSGPEFTKWLLLFGDVIIHPSIVARVDVIQHVGGYDPAMVHAEDYDLWVRATENKTKIVNLPDVLIKLRIHSGSISRVYASLQARNTNVIIKRALESVYGAKISASTVSALLYRSNQNTIDYFDAAKTLKQLCVKFLRDSKILGQERNSILNSASSRLYVLALNTLRKGPLLSVRIWWLILMISPGALPRLIGSTVKKLGYKVLGSVSGEEGRTE